MGASPYIKENLQAAFLLILTVTFLWVSNYTFDKKIAPLGDNAAYYLLGKSLAEGTGYTDLHGIEPATAYHFPPGYPVIIAGAIKFIGANVVGVKAINSLFLLSSILLFFFIIKRVTGNLHMAFVTGMICVLNVQLLTFSTVMMSEIPFLFFFLLSIYFLLRCDPKFRWNDRYFWFFILAMSFDFHIRTLGIALIGAAFFHFSFAKRWKQLGLSFIGFVLLALPWYLRGRGAGENDYVQNLLLKNKLRPELGQMSADDWLPRIARNSERYITKEIPASLFPKELDYTIAPTAGSWILGAVLLIIIAFGISRMKKWRMLVAGYSLATFTVLLGWPEIWVGPRFLIPLIPLFIVGIVQALVSLAEWIEQRMKQERKYMLSTIAAYLPLVLVLFSFSGINKMHETAINDGEHGVHNFVEMAKWSAKELPEGAIVVSRKPTVFYLHSEKKSTGYKYTTNPEEFLNDLIEKGVTHVVFDELGYRSYKEFLLPAARYYSGKFIPIYVPVKGGQSQLCEFHPELGYFGERKEGKRHGAGKFLSYDGSVYEGNWVDNQRSGLGTQQLANGHKYIGEWKNNVRHGRGKVFDTEGLAYMVGIWENGIFLQE